jgi:hypothetical protein
MGKSHAISGHFVQVGCGKVSGTKTSNISVALIIGKNDYNIGPGGPQVIVILTGGKTKQK